MKSFSMLIIMALIPIPTVHAWFLDPTTIRIANRSPIELYIALYYTKGTTGSRITGPFYLPPNNALFIELPPPQFLSTRQLCVALTPEDLPKLKDVSKDSLVTLGLFSPTDYTVTLNPTHATPQLCDTKTWLTYAPTTIGTPTTLTHEPLPIQEEYSHQRSITTKTTQEQFLGKSLRRPLHIGLCASGGGFRAMLAIAGIMCGLEKLEILPMIHTLLGLSGTTWFLFPWALSGQKPSEYTESMVHWLGQGLIHHLAQQYNDFATIIATKKAHRLSISGIDLYGISLAYTLLTPLHTNALTLTMTDVAETLTPEKYPLILGTAVTRPQPSDAYEWVLWSPFSLEFLNDHLTIPSSLVGAQFHTYQQISAPPSPLLCYLLGIFGSSFSISIRDALERIPETLQPIIQKLLPHSWQTRTWSNAKITAAKIANPRYKAPDSPHAHIKNISLVDGGYLNNLPLEPCVRATKIPYDLLIIVDCKQERPGRLKMFRNGYAAAQEYAPWLPEIDEEAITSLPFSVHGNPAEGSVVIYCTIEGDMTYDPAFNPALDSNYATPRLIYPAERAMRLVKYMEHIVMSHRDTFASIISVLAQKVD